MRKLSKEPGRLPFRLGTSSYIIPADILPNVDFLKDKVDDIELVLFESKELSNIPSSEVVRKLQEYADVWNLTYTVHLPYDVKAASYDEDERRHAVDTWIRVIKATCSLPVHGFIVHLEPERYRDENGRPCLDPADDIKKWEDRMKLSMTELREGTRDLVDPSLLCIETLSYNIMPFVPAILGSGFSLTLDVGHLWLNGCYSASYVKALLPYTRIIHLHGVRGLKDHQALTVNDKGQLSEFLSLLGQYRGLDLVVTLEIFSEEDLKDSLSLLDEMGVF